MSLVVAESMDDAVPAILYVLQHEVSCDVWLPRSNEGYWAALKQNQKPADELTAGELQAAMRMYKNPQLYHVKINPWPHWMYRGYHGGAKRSTF